MAAHVAEAEVPDDDCDDCVDEEDVCGIYAVGCPKCPPITVEVLVFGVSVQFEVDTGAASTLMSMETFRDVSTNGGHGGLTLSRSDAKLMLSRHTGNGERHTCRRRVQRRGEVRRPAPGPACSGCRVGRPEPAGPGLAGDPEVGLAEHPAGEKP